MSEANILQLTLTCCHFQLFPTWRTRNTSNCRDWFRCWLPLPHSSYEMIEYNWYILMLCLRHSIANKTCHISPEIMHFENVSKLKINCQPHISIANCNKRKKHTIVYLFWFHYNYAILWIVQMRNRCFVLSAIRIWLEIVMILRSWFLCAMDSNENKMQMFTLRAKIVDIISIKWKLSAWPTIKWERSMKMAKHVFNALSEMTWSGKNEIFFRFFTIPCLFWRINVAHGIQIFFKTLKVLRKLSSIFVSK